MSFINQNPVVKPVKLIYHQPNTTVYINLHLIPVRSPGTGPGVPIWDGTKTSLYFSLTYNLYNENSNLVPENQIIRCEIIGNRSFLNRG